MHNMHVHVYNIHIYIYTLFYIYFCKYCAFRMLCIHGSRFVCIYIYICATHTRKASMHAYRLTHKLLGGPGILVFGSISASHHKKHTSQASKSN